MLPGREEYLETIPPWLEDLLATRPAQHAQVIRPYASWSVLHRARHRAHRRASTRSVGKHARARILIAVHFLSWLDTRGLTLAAVTQHHVDAWLAGGTTTHYRLRDFLTWARARGLVDDISVPWLVREEPEHILAEDERWQLLRTCLTCQDVPLTLRVAGALVLLYGQMPSRIVELTTDCLIHKGRHTFLTLDRQPVVLPPRLADLVLGLAEHDPTGDAQSPSDPTRRGHGCSLAASRDDMLTPAGWPSSSTHSLASLFAPPATALCPRWQPTFQPRSSPTSWASTSLRPGAGPPWLNVTGPVMSWLDVMMSRSSRHELEVAGT